MVRDIAMRLCLCVTLRAKELVFQLEEECLGLKPKHPPFPCILIES